MRALWTAAGVSALLLLFGPFAPGLAAPLSPTPRVVEGIEIVGARRSSDQVVLSRLSVRIGDLVDEDELEASRLRLLSTGFFRRVEFGLRRGSKRGLVLLVVRIEERNTLRIEELAFGFGPGHVPFGSIGLAETNFLGQGVTVAGALALSEIQYGGQLRFFVPRLSGTRLQLSGTASFRRGQELIDPGRADGPTLDYERRGGSLGIGFGTGPAQRVSLVYRLESISVDRLPNLDPPTLRQAPSVLGDDSLFSSLAVTWERDTRDDAFAPTRGARLAVAVELGSSVIGSDYEFSKYTGEAQRALPLGDGQALVLRVFGGLVQGDIPFFHQFFRRDFALFALGRDALPRAVGLNFSRDNDYDDLVLDLGAEYTFPLLEAGRGLLERVLLYTGAGFTLTGSLEESQGDAGGRGAFDVFPVTADAGLKVDTAYGRFTLSLAYALDLAL